MNLSSSWLDLKLSLRMLTRYPFLTLIAVLSTAFAIGAGAVYFEIVNDLLYPKLPLNDGGQVVEIHNQDMASAAPEPRSLHDFVAWREGLRGVQDLAAFSTYTRNVGPAGGLAEPEEVVEISPAAFRVARIPALRGRPLVAGDEQPGAAPVVVIGERLWERRFGRDPAIVGKSLEVGSTQYTVVGVMPEAFALPVNQDVWIPFRENALDFPRRQGPAIGTIARLKPGYTLEKAQAELTVLGARLASEFPQSNERLRPRIQPYLEQFTPDPVESSARMGVNAVFMMLLAVICANVGALVFARIVTREKEFSVRTALGASRGRIVTQLFVEALLLTSIGAAIALAVVSWGLRNGEDFFWKTLGTAAPFWRDSGLNLTTILYVVTLAVVGAVFMGVIPGIKFTRGSIEASLRRSAAGGSGLRSRRMSTGVIVAQVALSGALMPIALSWTLGLNWSDPAYPGIRPQEYLTVSYGTEGPVGMEGGEAKATESAARMEEMHRALQQRLLAEPGFAAATFARQLPGSTHFPQLVEVKGEGNAAAGEVQRVRVASVGSEFFETFKTPILAGRGFRATDAASGQGVIVVNQPFVKAVLGGRNAVGRQIRFAASGSKEPGPWLEIVGVVPDLGMNPLRPDKAAGLYQLAKPEEMQSGFMAIRLEGGATDAAERFRAIAGQVDKSFLVYDTRRLDQRSDTELRMDRAFALLMVGVCFFIVALSAAVTFALMSFTVTQRKREIGIYRALGASPRAVLTSVFSRAVVQLGLGAGIGALISIFLFTRIPGSHFDPMLMLSVLASMLLMGVVSCGAPALNALRIEPTVALKEGL